MNTIINWKCENQTKCHWYSKMMRDYPNKPYLPLGWRSFNKQQYNKELISNFLSIMESELQLFNETNTTTNFKCANQTNCHLYSKIKRDHTNKLYLPLGWQLLNTWKFSQELRRNLLSTTDFILQWLIDFPLWQRFLNTWIQTRTYKELTINYGIWTSMVEWNGHINQLDWLDIIFQTVNKFMAKSAIIQLSHSPRPSIRLRGK